MGDAKFADGTPQSLYYAEDHKNLQGVFKGMAVILEERGYTNTSKIQEECKGFKCKKGANNCCCRTMLYNEPDFIAVESLLEIKCKARGFQVIFLPKFVTFCNTHSNFADIIQAEIFEPGPSDSIPHLLHNFTHLRVFPHISERFRHSQNHRTVFRVLSRPCLQILRSITLALIVSNSLALLLYYDL